MSFRLDDLNSVGDRELGSHRKPPPFEVEEELFPRLRALAHAVEAALRSLASEYAKEHIRFNAVAPGIVDTPLHTNDPKEFLKTLSPMGSISSVDDIASAVVYLTEARQITGEVLHVDGGAHVGKW